MKTLDRYVIREILPPFALALGMFTFLLAVKPMLEQATSLLAKGVDLPTVGFLLITLLPQALGVTIPMAFLAGVLMGLGRLSGDRETVAMLACGVSPVRLLRPVLVLGLVAGAADMYTLVKLVPDSNQRFRLETFKLLATKSEGDIKPGIFYQGFPGKVLQIRERLPEGGWGEVFLADISQPGRPAVTLAARGALEINQVKREVAIALRGEYIRYVPGEDPGVYDTSRATDLRIAVPADSVFGSGSLDVGRGRPEMTIADLREAEAKKRAEGISPHPEILQRHQMFSFPVACLVFAMLGLALGVHTRKEGKLGGFTLGLGVICAYYALMVLFEGRTKGGHFPAEWARWVPNIVLGLVGVWAVWWRSRSNGRELTVQWPVWLAPRRWVARRATTRPTDARARVVLVIRVPDFSLPRPRILDLYIAKRYLGVLLLTFFGLLCLYYIGTFVDKSERIFKGQADGWDMLTYFYYSTPQFVAYVVPMATLVAVLATIGGLTRSSELIVMRACGVSLYRSALPLVVPALGLSAALFMLDDRVLAQANQKAAQIEDRIKGNRLQPTDTISSTNWVVDKSNRIYYYSAFDIPNKTLFGLSVFELSKKPYRMVSHTLASKATFDRGAWQAESGWVQRFPTLDRSVRDKFAARPLNLAGPELFSGIQTQQAELMSFGDLRQHIQRLAESGLNLAESKVQLQTRLAFPMVAIVMTILGVPFGVTTGRRGALYGIGLAIILGSSYWLLNTFFVAIGQADLLPPFLAAWAANLLFMALAGYMILTVRT